MLKLAIGAVVLYCGLVALLYVAQRKLQYFPERRRTVPGRLACRRQKRLWSIPPMASG